MCWHVLSVSTILSGVFIIFTIVTSSHSQATTSHPQGHCSSYLNRYTSQEQCVYSFIVPKKDKDQCPGLAAEMDDLKEQMKQMQRWKEGINTNILLLSNSKEDNRRLGIAEAKAQMWTERFNNLTAENNRLRDQKSRLEIELSQNTINSQEAKAQLEEISKVQFPLQQNYTRLRTAYFALERRLGELQAQHDRLMEEHKELKNVKNCSDVNKHLPSCAVIKQWGYTKSGDAMIDPDGEGGVDPFLVYCDMDSDPTTGITVIKHGNQPKYPVSNCEEAGCFSLPVQYTEATLEQIRKLMSISLACEQFIRYDCFDSKLLKDNTAWWVSSAGEKMRYWGGASPGSKKCACGMDNTCVPTTEVCNCDADKEEWAFDEGMLRDKSTLPVVNLNFGDVNSAAGERGNVTLGPLKCKWNINMSVPSCDALLHAGVTGTGFFMVDEDGRGPLPPRRTLCNLPDFVTISEGTRTDPRQPGIDIPATGNPNEYIFTSCGKDESHEGPTERQCNSSYQDTNVRTTVRDGTQVWRVPRTGRYRIRAMAPSGFHLEQQKRGRGADMKAEFILEKNTEIRIIIGQSGNRHAGSGGTFIIRMFETYTSQPLLIAGAGGSSNSRRGDPTTLDASKNENGKDSSVVGQNFGKGGMNGNGGYRGGARTGPNTAGGGAGFKLDGEKSSDDRFTPLPTPAIKANTNGVGNLAAGVGGTYTYETSSGVKRALHGGFGGGGSASKNGPGGGGGYSGGGGGPANGFSGGGGSYVRTTEATGYTFQYNSNPYGGARFIYLGEAPGQKDKES